MLGPLSRIPKEIPQSVSNKMNANNIILSAAKNANEKFHNMLTIMKIVNLMRVIVISNIGKTKSVPLSPFFEQNCP
jgi:hypothetical protein